METPTAPAGPPQREPEPGPFQFRLGTLLIATTGVAVLLSGLFAGPRWAAMTLSLALILLPAGAAIAFASGRGLERTFWIGALLPLTVFLVWGGLTGLVVLDRSEFGPDSHAAGLAAMAIILIDVATAIGFGLLAMGLRWLVERNAQSTKDRPGSTPC